MRPLRIVAAAIAVLIFSTQPATSGCAQLVAGSEFEYAVQRGDSLASISSRYGASADSIARENGIKRYATLRRGQLLRIDNRHVVPEPLSRGIVINIPQRMLFFFDEGKLVSYYPVALGRPTWRTVVRSFVVVGKREKPTWTVPESIQREMEIEGKEVKSFVLPGPDNPLGEYAIDLSIPNYLIHGTIAPLSIYAFRTHGCIRLHPDDIADLYGKVRLGDPGEIVYEPVMLAVLADGRIFFEVNRDVYKKGPEPMQFVSALAEAEGLRDKIDWESAAEVIREKAGIAREIERENTAARELPR